MELPSDTIVWKKALKCDNPILKDVSVETLPLAERAYQEACRGDVVEVRRTLEKMSSGKKDETRPDYGNGESLLHVAIAARQQAVAAMLVKDFGADVNCASYDGVTPLMKACENQLEETVRLLVARGADVNIQDNFGSTALSRGVKSGWGACGSILVDAGANSNLRDRYGRNARQDALHSGNVESALKLSGPSAILVPGFESPKVQSLDGISSIIRDVVLYFLDVSSDVLVGVTILSDDELQDKWVGIVILVFVCLPGFIAFFLPDQTGLERLLSLLQLRFLYETAVSLSQERFTIRYQTIQFLMSLAEDIPNLLLQTFLVFQSVYIDRTASSRDVFDSVFIFSFAVSLISNSQTGYVTYLQRFMSDADSMVKNMMLGIAGSAYAVVNVFLRFQMFIGLAIYAAKSQGPQGYVIRPLACFIPFLIWARNYHIANVHQANFLQTDVFASLGFDGAFAQNKKAFVALSVFSIFDIIIWGLFPLLLGVAGVQPFQISSGGARDLPMVLILTSLITLQLILLQSVLQQATTLNWPGYPRRDSKVEGANDDTESGTVAVGQVTSFAGLDNQVRAGPDATFVAILAADGNEVAKQVHKGCSRLPQAKEPVSFRDIKLSECACFFTAIPGAIGAILSTVIGAILMTGTYLNQVYGSLRSKSKEIDGKHTTRHKRTKMISRRGFKLTHVPQFLLGTAFLLLLGLTGLCYEQRANGSLGAKVKCPETLLEKPELAFVALGLIYLVAVIEAFRCSEGRYLRKMLPVERGFDVLCRFQGSTPRIKWKITCFHLKQNALHDKFIARQLTEGSIIPKKAIVVTHVREKEFEFDCAWNEMSHLPPIAGACRLKVTHGYAFADDATKAAFESQKKAFIDEHKECDLMYTIEEKFSLLSSFQSEQESPKELRQEKRLLLYNEFETSRFLRFAYYALASSALLSLPFRVLSPEAQSASASAVKILRKSPNNR